MRMQSPKLPKKRGFTLAEVIVVAVIVAILAAVAIPIYQQYVINSGNNAAENAAGSFASFGGACRASGGTGTASARHDDGDSTISITF